MNGRKVIRKGCEFDEIHMDVQRSEHMEQLLLWWVRRRNFFVFDNKKGGNGLAVGVLSGISLIIYALVRNIEKPIPFDKNLLYWISLGLGVIVGAIVSGYLLRRAKRKVEENARVYPCRLEEKRKLAKQNRKSFFSTYGINCYFYRSMCGIPIFDGLDCAIRSGICFF